MAKADNKATGGKSPPAKPAASKPATSKPAPAKVEGAEKMREKRTITEKAGV